MKHKNPTWQKVKLGEVITLHRGYDLLVEKMKSGKHPVIFSNGKIEYHNQYKIKGPGVITGRSGALGNIFYIEKDYWPHNTTLYVSDFHGNDPKFVYYFLKQLDLTLLNSGTGVPTLNRNFVHGIPIDIPKDLDVQSRIASILSAFDDKIELNNKINATLERMAQEIFKEWFVRFNFPVFRSINAPQPPEGVARAGDKLDRPRVVNSANKFLYDKLEEKAKEMRNNPTEAEAILWKELRDKKLGVKFRRQHVIYQFIADFYCVSAGLVIEVDGDVHDHQQERDSERDNILQGLGCRILRFKNKEVLNNLSNVLQKITTTLKPPLGGLGALKGTKLGYRDSGGEMVDSELGKIPKGWEVIQLSDIVQIRYGKDLPTKELLNEGFPVYGGNGVIGYTNKFLFEVPQVIVGCRGAYSGNVFKTDPKCFVTHNSLVLHTEKLSTDFLFYSLLHSNVKSTVTGSAQPQITINELSNLPIVIPDKKTLSKFELIIKSIEDKRYVLKQENKKLAKLRDLLLPKLMKGEVRV